LKTEATTGHPLRVGVVGLGWAGQQHLQAYSSIEGVEVIGLAGMEEHLREELSQTFTVPHTFPTWEELLELEDLDAVSIAVPTFLHAPIAVAALKRGLHVLGEKPLARNSAEGQQMVEAAREAGRVLDVAFNHRRRGDIQKVRGTIASGEVGAPYYAKASWLRRQGIPTLGSWFTNKELSGGGPLADLGVHVLDYALFLLGEPKAVSVTAATYSQLGPRGRGGHSRETATAGTHEFGVEDFASAFIRFEDGATLVLESGWAAYRETEDLIDFMVYGSEGGIELRAVGATKTPVGTMRVFADRDGENADYELSAEPGRNHQQVVEDFVDIIRSGPDAWTQHDGTVALERARILDACYVSAEEKREVRIEHV
jgi:predicted dehydrogenase